MIICIGILFFWMRFKIWVHVYILCCWMTIQAVSPRYLMTIHGRTTLLDWSFFSSISIPDFVNKMAIIYIFPSFVYFYELLGLLFENPFPLIHSFLPICSCNMQLTAKTFNKKGMNSDIELPISKLSNYTTPFCKVFFLINYN